jgi:UDP-2,3-diacylglucosamine hydrolase
MRTSGCQALSDPTVIDLYGMPTLLMHGDSLCTDDVSHQRFRRFTQNRFYQRLFLCLPLRLRQWIARRVRNASRERFVAANYVMVDVAQSAVEQVMTQHRVSRLIHGHTHRPGMHEFMLQNTSARRIVLGDWHKQGSVLYVPEQGEVKLMEMEL